MPDKIELDLWGALKMWLFEAINAARPIIESFVVGLVLALGNALLNILESQQPFTLAELWIVLAGAAFNYVTSWARKLKAEYEEEARRAQEERLLDFIAGRGNNPLESPGGGPNAYPTT